MGARRGVASDDRRPTTDERQTTTREPRTKNREPEPPTPNRFLNFQFSILNSGMAHNCPDCTGYSGPGVRSLARPIHAGVGYTTELGVGAGRDRPDGAAVGAQSALAVRR